MYDKSLNNKLHHVLSYTTLFNCTDYFNSVITCNTAIWEQKASVASDCYCNKYPFHRFHMNFSLYKIPAALQIICWTGIITVKKLWSSSLVSFHYSTLCNDSLRFLTVRSFSQVIANNSCWAASAAFSVFSKSISRCLHCQSHKSIPMHINMRRTTWEKNRFKMS